MHLAALLRGEKRDQADAYIELLFFHPPADMAHVELPILEAPCSRLLVDFRSNLRDSARPAFRDGIGHPHVQFFMVAKRSGGDVEQQRNLRLGQSARGVLLNLGQLFIGELELRFSKVVQHFSRPFLWGEL